MLWTSTWWRAGVAVIAAGLVCVACGDGSGDPSGGDPGGGDPSGSGGGPTTLFADSFDGSFPAPNWSAIPATAALDPAAGVPPGSLHLLSGGDAILATSPFSTAGGLTFSVWVSLDSLGGSTPSPVALSVSEVVVQVQTQAGGRQAAFIQIIPHIPGFAQHMYQIQTDRGPVSAFFTDTIPLDGAWHHYTFAVATDGSARLSRDGAIKLQTSGTMVVNSSDLLLRLRVAGAEGHMDEVTVTRP